MLYDFVLPPDSARFNRTKLELKAEAKAKMEEVRACFNRTKLELKATSNKCVTSCVICFNRTKLELRSIWSNQFMEIGYPTAMAVFEIDLLRVR